MEPREEFDVAFTIHGLRNTFITVAESLDISPDSSTGGRALGTSTEPVVIALPVVSHRDLGDLVRFVSAPVFPFSGD